MKKISAFIQSLQFIFKPHYWIMLGMYDKEWDAKINALAKEHSFKSEAGKYSDNISYVSLGGVHMWVGNFPYSFFAQLTIKSIHTYGDGDRSIFYEYQDSETQSRPSRLTIHKLTKKLLADLNMKDTKLKLEK
ncbi:MAG: hypothetical protein ORN50_06475 [Crocinitomicaceae bacterium]|nr:hypothetical protein [Crocinitomicaceae bacterium]